MENLGNQVLYWTSGLLGFIFGFIVLGYWVLGSTNILGTVDPAKSDGFGALVVLSLLLGIIAGILSYFGVKSILNRKN